MIKQQARLARLRLADGDTRLLNQAPQQRGSVAVDYAAPANDHAPLRVQDRQKRSAKQLTISQRRGTCIHASQKTLLDSPTLQLAHLGRANSNGPVFSGRSELASLPSTKYGS